MQDVGPEADFNPQTYVPKVITLVAGHRRGRQDHRLRPQDDPDARHRASSTLAVRRDLHPLRPPGLPGPLRAGRRALHLPVPRRRLRLRRQGRRRPARPPARPLLDEGARTAACSSASASRVNSQARQVPPARPLEPPRRAVAVPLPVEADHMKHPPRTTAPQDGSDDAPRTAATATAANGLHRRGRRGSDGAREQASASAEGGRARGADRRPRLGRRAHRRSARSCAASSSARSRRAPTGSTRSARPRCSPSSRRR